VNATTETDMEEQVGGLDPDELRLIDAYWRAAN
jgi:hypothetical protein